VLSQRYLAAGNRRFAAKNAESRAICPACAAFDAFFELIFNPLERGGGLV